MEEKKTPRADIIAEQCKGCRLCVSECPQELIEMSEELNHLGYPYAVFNDPEDKCTGCGLCYYACPEAGTITVYRKQRK